MSTSNSGLTAERMAIGRTRLHDWLPRAKAEIAVKPDAWQHESLSALYDAMAPYVRQDNLASLVVYPAPKGGWIADLILRETPPGVSNVMGTPVGHPHATEAEAEETAYRLLTVALVMERDMTAGKIAKGPPAFLLGDFQIDLNPDIYKIMYEVDPKVVNVYGSKAGAEQRLTTAIADLLPGGITQEGLNALTPDQSRTLMSVIHLVALRGVLAYPLRTPQPPGAPVPEEGSDMAEHDCDRTQ